MRIIGGQFKGKTLKIPKGLPVRPTTDFAKEGLFNILTNVIYFDEVEVLDLFTGTGHISLEFASRGCNNIVAVDKHFACVNFLNRTAVELKLPINAVKQDVFAFLNSTKKQFDLIFADPPYDLVNINLIHEIVFSKQLLKNNGMLIIEHGANTHLETLIGFEKIKKYGNVNFSFFKNS
ncbi:MAG: 16S rRNA (guanine(966)-N(2))-methyltransferase RsmD [Bacteroidetes bacterium]|nr:16S rRNA (guanine(966)-N(2))-methyltransferase RsmD [Bacteroidota bacterium]